MSLSMNENMPYLLAYSATAVFGLSCIFYTVFANRISPIWVNTIKACVGTLGFFLTTTLFYEWNSISWQSLSSFFVSGFIGLGIGDLFLILAFTRIGAARTLMVFSCGPLFTGLQGYFFFGQTLSMNKLFAIVFLITCLFILSYEGYKEKGQWEFKGVVFALLGVLFDAIGIGLTRFGFENSAQVIPIEANFYRAIGALVFFIIYNQVRPIHLVSEFKKLIPKEKSIILLASVMGTYVSLWLWNTAVKYGHLASISAIAAAEPFTVAVFEHIYLKKWPTKYLLIASVFFSCGMFFLFYK